MSKRKSKDDDVVLVVLPVDMVEHMIPEWAIATIECGQCRAPCVVDQGNVKHVTSGKMRTMCNRCMDKADPQWRQKAGRVLVQGHNANIPGHLNPWRRNN